MEPADLALTPAQQLQLVTDAIDHEHRELARDVEHHTKELTRLHQRADELRTELVNPEPHPRTIGGPKPHQARPSNVVQLTPR